VRWAVAAAAALLAPAFVSPAAAQSVKQIGAFHDWSAYSATSSDGEICFAVSKPQEVVPSPDGYTQGYLYLTHRPAQQITNELNFVAGVTLDASQPASLSIGGQSFPLFVQADSAWLDDPTQNDTLAGVMRAGTAAVIDATTDKGIKIRETFSLAGATAASKAINGSC
jgi:hypothetical protein